MSMKWRRILVGLVAAARHRTKQDRGRPTTR
jgi:hypothetical protein